MSMSTTGATQVGAGRVLLPFVAIPSPTFFPKINSKTPEFAMPTKRIKRPNETRTRTKALRPLYILRHVLPCRCYWGSIGLEDWFSDGIKLAFCWDDGGFQHITDCTCRILTSSDDDEASSGRDCDCDCDDGCILKRIGRRTRLVHIVSVLGVVTTIQDRLPGCGMWDLASSLVWQENSSRLRWK
ncbi:hypothetical protein M422DRAFT_249484 [Sphaerobolus stellatus SS14]|uniref:Uncharacterized protein n=1 Tax=Sphaerobolus stellatus (strain SS14) TaxID=990650 RepID=A0A0C9VUT8_SPHS4|nr:hypothetical protein M422DRAFT_249484 [Sphaerobolus stellatus SS14]